MDKSDEEMRKEYILVALVGRVPVTKGMIKITGRHVETEDGKQIGWLLEDGKVLIRLKAEE
jgi:ABC-type uncharacterized transport system ATPase subunit